MKPNRNRMQDARMKKYRVAEPLKLFFSPQLVRRLADDVERVHPAFARREFVRQACTGLDDARAPRSRQAHRARARGAPARVVSRRDRRARPLARPRARVRRARRRRHGAFLLPAARALRRRARARSLRRVDAGAIRADQALQRRIEHPAVHREIPRADVRRPARWTQDANPHVRRLVSEGTRLRLPWAMRVAWLDEHPERVLELLELLKDDPATLVRRSVANNLNDLGKVRPDLLARTCAAWLENASAERRALVEHALRSAVKRGDAGALRLLGYGKKASASIEQVRISPKRVDIGGRVSIGFVVRSTSRAPQDLLVDIAVHFVKAGGKSSPKVFKLTRATLRAARPARTANVGLAGRPHDPQAAARTPCGRRHHQRHAAAASARSRSSARRRKGRRRR